MKDVGLAVHGIGLLKMRCKMSAHWLRARVELFVPGKPSRKLRTWRAPQRRQPLESGMGIKFSGSKSTLFDC